MKKAFSLLLTTVLFVTLLNPINIYATEQDTKLDGEELIEKTDLLENMLFILDGKEVNIKSIKFLYDIELKPNYLYIEFEGKGYAIATRENLDLLVINYESSNMPFKDYDLNEKIVYGGPYNYYRVDNENFVNINTNEIINANSVTEEAKDLNREILVDKNEKLVMQAKSSNLLRVTAYSWKGIDSSRFSKYNGWINRNNQCGTYAAATLLAYYDDYVNNNFVPDNLRSRNSTNGTNLINSVYNYIDKVSPGGTLPSQVGGGLSNWLFRYSSSHAANYSISGTWDMATSTIGSSNSGKPIAIGTLSILGNTDYGNHWVVAYKHKLTSNDDGYYMVIDNQGNYTAQVKAKQTRGFVKITK